MPISGHKCDAKATIFALTKLCYIIYKVITLKMSKMIMLTKLTKTLEHTKVAKVHYCAVRLST